MCIVWMCQGTDGKTVGHVFNKINLPSGFVNAFVAVAQNNVTNITIPNVENFIMFVVLTRYVYVYIECVTNTHYPRVVKVSTCLRQMLVNECNNNNNK